MLLNETPIQYCAQYMPLLIQETLLAYPHITKEYTVASSDRPSIFGSCLSILFIFSPTVDIQLVSYASVINFSSSPCIVGDERYTFLSKGFTPSRSENIMRPSCLCLQVSYRRTCSARRTARIDRSDRSARICRIFRICCNVRYFRNIRNNRGRKRASTYRG